MTDTIFALATAPGRAGVGVIRLSGPQSGPVLQSITGRKLPPPRRAILTTFRGADGGVLDRGLALWFPKPGSFTGEDVVELHIHGGRAVVSAIYRHLSGQPGLRMAEAGEFAKRAFFNGNLDLTEAEGLADLVAAETEAQRRQAVRQLGGELGAIYERWRREMLRGLAHLEAAIDFSDEPLPKDLDEGVRRGLAGLRDEIARHLADNRRGERLRAGVYIAILGPPNVGKSRLINMLSRREAAIVSATAGTTRDVIEVQLDIGGYPVVLADTAGLRASSDAIENEGVKRAIQQAEAADLKIVVLDAVTWPEIPQKAMDLIDQNTLIVVNKADLCLVMKPPKVLDSVHIMNINPLSVEQGVGVSAFLAELQRAIEGRFGLGETAGITRARHRVALEECRARLESYLGGDLHAELAAEEVRLAVRSLGRITGRVGVEDILDVVFSDFCVGK